MTTRFAQMHVGFVSAVLLTPRRWFTTRLTKFLGRYPIFDLNVRSAIRHHAFGCSGSRLTYSFSGVKVPDLAETRSGGGS